MQQAMRSLNSKYYITFALLASLIILNSCDRDNNHPGFAYYPDMVDSKAYESYSENPNFTDNSSFREPVTGTVARGHQPMDYTKDLEDRARAGRELSNPIELNQETIKRGREMYIRTCVQCHGPDGDGKGHLFTTKLYPYPPASLVNDKMKAMPDGEIFHSITYGYGVMGSHAPIIVPEDRWMIIHYLKEELQAIN